MLTVIFIIGTLSTIVVVGLQSSRQKARDDERVTDLANIQMELEMYYNACGRQYPATLVTTANNGCPTDASGNPLVTLATFLKSGTLPKDPKTGNDYGYGVNDASKPTDYVLKAEFETNNQQALSDDVDGTNYTVDCDEDPSTPKFNYCVKP